MKTNWRRLMFAAALTTAGCEMPTTMTDTGGGTDATDRVSVEDTGTSDGSVMIDGGNTDTGVDDAAIDDVPTGVDTGGTSTGELLTSEVPGDIAVANGSIYFTRDTFVRRMPIAGGTPENFYTATMSAPSAIAADATGIAWTERFASTVQGAVRSCPHAGCPATPTAYSGGESTNRVAVAPSHVAWTSVSNATVHIRDRASGAGGSSYMASNTAQYTPTDVALDGDDFYWTTAGITTGTVMHCNVSGGSCAPMPLTTDMMIGRPDRIALGPGVVYFLSNTGVFRIGRDGSGLTRLAMVTTGFGMNTFDLATDGTTLYWAVGGTLSSCTAASCTPTTIAALGPGFTQGLEVDATSVYWGTMDLSRSGGIRRFAR